MIIILLEKNELERDTLTIIHFHHFNGTTCHIHRTAYHLNESVGALSNRHFQRTTCCIRRTATVSYTYNLRPSLFRPIATSIANDLSHASHCREPYPCDMWVKSFTDISNLTEHRRTHSSQKPYDPCASSCVPSDRWYLWMTLLTYHMAKVLARAIHATSRFQRWRFDEASTTDSFSLLTPVNDFQHAGTVSHPYASFVVSSNGHF